MLTRIHTHTHTHIYIYIYIYIQGSPWGNFLKNNNLFFRFFSINVNSALFIAILFWSHWNICFEAIRMVVADGKEKQILVKKY